MDLNKRIDFEANLNVSPIQIDHLMAKGGLISDEYFSHFGHLLYAKLLMGDDTETGSSTSSES